MLRRSRSLLVPIALLVGLVPANADAQAQRRRRRTPPTAQQATATGSLVVRGVPDGAELLVDEASAGRAPLGAISTSPGDHTLRVRLDGYAEYTDIVTVPSGGEVAVDVELIPLAHVLELTSIPSGARVFVDGVYAGETPASLELEAGSRELRLQMDGYADAAQTVDAVLGESSRLTLTLAAVEAPRQQEWFEDPIVWVVVGGVLIAAAGITVAVVVATQPQGSAIDPFCMGSQPCVRFDTPF